MSTDLRQLEGSVAIVTGASRGLGRAYAIDLAECGASLVVTARDSGELAKTKALVEAAGGRCEQVIGDVTDPETAATCLRRAEQRLGDVDILVNNAGIVDIRLFADADRQDWWSVFEVNVRAPAEWTAIVAPGMRARHRGRILNISSPGGFVPLPFYSAYCSSKVALSQLTACLAIELSVDGVKVFALGPRAHTDMTRSLYENDVVAPAMREASRAAFTSNEAEIMRASVALFRFVATGGADHLSGGYFGDHLPGFDTPSDLEKRVQHPTIASLSAMLAT